MARPDRSSKGRRGYKDRNVNSREERQRFLIVCEGSKTEPNYFKEFRTAKLVIKIEGPALTPIQLVDEANRISLEDNYDQVWCVFDRDDWPIDKFNNAFSKARAKRIKVAYTNEAFELWYLLHFNYHDTAIGREAYKAKLTANLVETYEKNDPAMYSKLKTRMNTAYPECKTFISPV